jgi:hypothetical protein
VDFRRSDYSGISGGRPSNVVVNISQTESAEWDPHSSSEWLPTRQEDTTSFLLLNLKNTRF